MKRKFVRAGLLAAGGVLLCLSLVLAIGSAAGKTIIGGAGLPTFFFVLFQERGGLYHRLALFGDVLVILSLLAGRQKKGGREE